MEGPRKGQLKRISRDSILCSQRIGNETIPISKLKNHITMHGAMTKELRKVLPL